MKLHHLVSDKIHARRRLGHSATIGGKAQYGGQRFGEMEVWAREAYSMLMPCKCATVKSDDVAGQGAFTSQLLRKM